MKWFKFSLSDSRGAESRTLFFVTASWLVLLLKFGLADWSAHWQMIDIKMAPMTATEFGAAVVCILGIWLGREWSEKRKVDQPGAANANP